MNEECLYNQATHPRLRYSFHVPAQSQGYFGIGRKGGVFAY